MVETLMKAGASISGERERDGQTPLHAAAEGGRCGTCCSLLVPPECRNRLLYKCCAIYDIYEGVNRPTG